MGKSLKSVAIRSDPAHYVLKRTLLGQFSTQAVPEASECWPLAKAAGRVLELGRGTRLIIAKHTDDAR